MKSFAIIAVALSAASVHAQLGGIPTCATDCVTGSLSSVTGCTGLDIACICKSTSFIASITVCVEKACSAADIAATEKAALALCEGAGVTISLPPPPPATSAAPPATSAAPPVSVAPVSVAPVSSAAPVYSSPAPVYSSVPPPVYTSAPVYSAPATLITITSSVPCSSTNVVTVYSVTTSSPVVPVTGYNYTSPASNATIPAPVPYTGAASMTTFSSLAAVIAVAVAGLIL